MILILKYKHGDYPIYARTHEEELRAYMHLFLLMDKWGFYEDLVYDEKTWYTEAKGGSESSARELLRYRSHRGYEYEQIEELEPVEP